MIDQEEGRDLAISVQKSRTDPESRFRQDVHRRGTLLLHFQVGSFLFI